MPGKLLSGIIVESLLHINEPIMHKFIFKHGDIDDEIFDGIYSSLIIFYDFLRKHKLVGSEEYKEFVKKINGIKTKLRKKMHRYNEIRHDDSISEEEKEDIREELFEGDHVWPLL